jgi:hypothetical protein
MSTSPKLCPNGNSQLIPLASIRTDDGCQARVKIRPAIVREYAQAMTQQQGEGGLRFPPVVLFTDGTNHWLSDGFHRVLAARAAGLSEILADVHPGTQRAALLYALSTNTEHGLPRTNADKRKAVALLLSDSEWSQWSDREIARRCQVGNRLVSGMRKSASVSGTQMRERKVRRASRVYEMAINQNQTSSERVKEKGDSPTEARAARPVVAALLTDRLDIAVPEFLVQTFAALPDFEEAKQLFAKLTELLDRLAKKPGGELLRRHLSRKVEEGKESWTCAELCASLHKVLAAEPYCSYCPYCHLAHPGFSHPDCKICWGWGWTTQTAFDSCPESYRQEILRLRRDPQKP